MHAARAALLHTWADDANLEVIDWGETDCEYPREFVEILVPIGVEVLKAALGTLVSEYVKRFYAKRRGSTQRTGTPSEGTEAPQVTPLMAVTVVNQRGGTVIFRDRASPAEAKTC